MKKILSSKWNIVITLSLVTAIVLVVTLSFAFKSNLLNIAKENIRLTARVQQLSEKNSYIHQTKMANAGATVEEVFEVAAGYEDPNAESTSEETVEEPTTAAPEENSYDQSGELDASEETSNSYAMDLSSAAGDYYSASELKFHGVIFSGGWRWTWYSQNVLPGGGLSIPGRHVDENGFICDENDRICLASEDLAYGTVVSTPFGKEGCVYDCGCDYGTLDVYVNF